MHEIPNRYIKDLEKTKMNPFKNILLYFSFILLINCSTRETIENNIEGVVFKDANTAYVFVHKTKDKDRAGILGGVDQIENGIDVYTVNYKDKTTPQKIIYFELQKHTSGVDLKHVNKTVWIPNSSRKLNYFDLQTNSFHLTSLDAEFALDGFIAYSFENNRQILRLNERTYSIYNQETSTLDTSGVGALRYSDGRIYNAFFIAAEDSYAIDFVDSSTIVFVNLDTKELLTAPEIPTSSKILQDFLEVFYVNNTEINLRVLDSKLDKYWINFNGSEKEFNGNWVNGSPPNYNPSKEYTGSSTSKNISFENQNNGNEIHYMLDEFN